MVYTAEPWLSKGNQEMPSDQGGHNQMVHLNNWEISIKGCHPGFLSSPYIGEEALYVFLSS